MMKGSDLFILVVIILSGLMVTGYTAAQYFRGVRSEYQTTNAQNERNTLENDFRTQLTAKNEEIRGLQSQAIDKLNDANTKLKDANKKAKELITIYDKLVAENIKIQRVQNETIKLTIGEGFPNITITNFDGDNYVVRIFNKGNYPLFNVSLSMYDVDLVKKSCIFAMDKGSLVVDLNHLASYSMNFQNENTIRPGGGIFLNPTIVLKEGYTNLDFKVHARHKSFLYRYVIECRNKVVSFVYKVYDITSSGKVEISTEGDLIVPESYWEDNFLPLNLKNGRVIGPNEN